MYIRAISFVRHSSIDLDLQPLLLQLSLHGAITRLVEEHVGQLVVDPRVEGEVHVEGEPTGAV